MEIFRKEASGMRGNEKTDVSLFAVYKGMRVEFISHKTQKTKESLSGFNLRKMSKGRAITFLGLLALLFSLSECRPINNLPQTFTSFKVKNTTQSVGRGCSYTVEIVTSCSSPRSTSDEISLVFGDAYENEVYIHRLNDPYSSTFDRCSQDTFDISNGPCVNDICYLYVKRSGYDGWKPETITVYGYSTRTITFTYNHFVPDDVWYGFDFCDYSSSAVSASSSTA
ncbi:embryo-specific protein ATS3A-like [Euphorbia lathyris]|uniref:embryo-specific protein ATS3A-like n=1 Tax=Euphorbia lathyris TaxID=212925 RepID=UPI00331349A8